jgi:hypothetical protein
VIGPLLFTIFMLDLPKCVNSQISQYADDSTLSRAIESEADIVALQSDLDAVYLWCLLNHMYLNADKSSYIRVSRVRVPFESSYHINSVVIPVENQFKLLGISITNKLKWNLQTEVVRKKTSRVLGMLSRCFSRSKLQAKRMLYVALARSCITYGAPAWHPTTACNALKLERLQSRATRFILGYSRRAMCDDNCIRLIRCNLPSLSELWKSIDLKFLSRCFSGRYDFNVFDASKISVRERRPGLRGSASVLSCLRGDASYLASYFPRVVRLYNELPVIARAPLPI